MFALEGDPETIAAAAELVIRALGPDAVAAVQAQLTTILAEAVEVSGAD